jgi:pyruvate formate lyase activating enzyme
MEAALKKSTQGVLLQMQDYSIHDGDGVRTTVFLAGCGLRCQWCANPESWTTNSKLAFYQHKCSACGRCKQLCPQGLNPAGKNFLQADCTACGACVSTCLENALQIACSQEESQTVMNKIKRDELFFRYSGGGVTFSGGEPFMQHQFLRQLLNECEQLGISVWVETCGFFSWQQCKDLMPKIEHVFFDIKHMDDDIHLRFTGQSNKGILQNAKNIYAMQVPLTIRIPLIAEVNLDEENLRATAEFISSQLRGSSVELLPYHELGKAKYSAFRMEKEFHSFTSPSAQQLQSAYAIFSQYQIERYQ